MWSAYGWTHSNHRKLFSDSLMRIWQATHTPYGSQRHFRRQAIHGAFELIIGILMHLQSISLNPRQQNTIHTPSND